MTGISDAEGAAAVETVRRLRRQEHSRTRGLYETVFPEDSQRFVDYYYERVAKENEIYVVEDGEEIRAMLHLNPYPVVCTIPSICCIILWRWGRIPRTGTGE